MKPILFNAEMVRAILADQKQVTRRVVKPRYRNGEAGFRIVTNAHTGKYVRVEYFDEWEDETRWMAEPYHPGDILYVRETWAAWSRTYGAVPVLYYKADGNAPDGIKWHPSIHMPREAARIFLRVTDVRVEKLQAMGHEDAEQEGCWCDDGGLAMPLDKFADLWDSTIKPADRALYGWEANPWVWVIEFERCQKPGAAP